MSSRKTGWVFPLLFLVLAASLFFGYKWWRADNLREQVAARIPRRPNLGTSLPAIRDHVARAEERARSTWDSLPGLVELTRVYHANGFFTEARQGYQSLLRIEPKNPRWPDLLSTIMGGSGELDAAIPLLRQVIVLAPDFLPARLRLGDTLFKTNQSAEAVKAYAPVLAREPRNPYALLGMARIDLASNEWTNARQRLQELLEAHADFGAAWTLLATIDEHLGRAAEAAADREKAKTSASFNDVPDPWVDELLNECYDVYRLRVAAATSASAGESANGLKLLKRAQSLAPENGSVERDLGKLYDLLHDPAQARLHFERATALDPDDADNWNFLIAFLNAAGDSAAAERAITAGLARCPQSPSLHYERGRRLVAEGRLLEALPEFREARRLRPSEANAYVELAQIDFKLNRLDEGISELRSALTVEPDHPIALGILARYAIETADEKGAKDLIARAEKQIKFSRDDFAALVAEFKAKFGHAP